MNSIISGIKNTMGQNRQIVNNTQMPNTVFIDLQSERRPRNFDLYMTSHTDEITGRNNKDLSNILSESNNTLFNAADTQLNPDDNSPSLNNSRVENDNFN